MNSSAQPLHYRTVSAPTPAADSRLVLAHGFTQNSNCWGPFPDLLAETAEAELRLVDLPGHGQSHADESTLTEAGAMLAATGGKAVYVGYSMGGRVALHAALAAPESVTALVLIGATAGITDDDERAARRERDEELAASIEATGTEAFIDRWLATPLFAALTPEQQCREQRLTNRTEGLAASLRNCGTGTQTPLHDQLASLTMPVLSIAGEFDDKFRSLGATLVDAIGANASLAIVPGAGHACHLEFPAATATIITDWLSDVR